MAVLDNRGRSMDADVLFGAKKKKKIDGDKSELFQSTVTKLQQFFFPTSFKNTSSKAVIPGNDSQLFPAEKLQRHNRILEKNNKK